MTSIGQLQIEEFWNMMVYKRRQVGASAYIGIIYGHWGTEYVNELEERESEARRVWLDSRDRLLEAGGHPIVP